MINDKVKRKVKKLLYWLVLTSNYVDTVDLNTVNLKSTTKDIAEFDETLWAEFKSAKIIITNILPRAVTNKNNIIQGLNRYLKYVLYKHSLLYIGYCTLAILIAQRFYTSQAIFGSSYIW